MQNSLELALIGNCQVGALVDPQAEIVWYCLPRFDGDPAFCSLLQEHESGSGTGYCSVEIMDLVACERSYLPNSAVLVTRMTDSRGAVLEVTDFAPRFRQHGRMYTPMMLIRQVRRLHGSPRITLRVRPPLLAARLLLRGQRAESPGRHPHHGALPRVSGERGGRLRWGLLQPVYGIDGKLKLEELEVTTLAGYRGMGPVRVGNQAYEQVQHDVYGSAVLAVTHVFFDQRLMQRGDVPLFHRLEPLGEKAIQVHDQPDAGLWELRGTRRVHTFSSIMCWAACDRLSKIALRLNLPERASYWGVQAQRIHATICARAWNDQKRSFTAAFDVEALDASLLLMHDVGFLAADDPRFASTVAAIERELRQGDYIFRYVEKDDFGAPENAFIVCTYWYIYALVALGRNDEARMLFENLLARHNRHGLMAEHLDVRTGEQWGNFVQAYSMVGLINAAIRLSKRWDSAF